MSLGAVIGRRVAGEYKSTLALGSSSPHSTKVGNVVIVDAEKGTFERRVQLLQR